MYHICKQLRSSEVPSTTDEEVNVKQKLSFSDEVHIFAVHAGDVDAAQNKSCWFTDKQIKAEESVIYGEIGKQTRIHIVFPRRPVNLRGNCNAMNMELRKFNFIL